jgi:NTE family protein
MRWGGKRIGLALGSGGARGLAHIGVLRVLEKENIPIDLLVGTSVGALVGGAYASGIGPDELEKKVDEFLNSPEFQSSAIQAIEAAHAREEGGVVQKVQSYLKNRFYVVQAMLKPGILSNEEFQAIVNNFIPDIQIEETRISFRTAATDLVSGELITFSSGSLRQAVMASCAVPGAIEPLRDGTMVLSNGGIICLVPTSIAKKEGADIVIAVAVDRDTCSEEEFRTAADIYVRASEITAYRLKDYELMDADVIIRPEVGNLHWSHFSQARNLVEEGEKATRENLEAIRNAVPSIKRWFTLKRILNSHRREEKG